MNSSFSVIVSMGAPDTRDVRLLARIRADTGAFGGGGGMTASPPALGTLAHGTPGLVPVHTTKPLRLSMGIFDTSMSFVSSNGRCPGALGGTVESAGHGPSGAAGGCSVLEALTALFLSFGILRGGSGGEAIASESRLGGSEFGGGGTTPT